MPSIVISDTSSLILLSKIEELELLNRLYDIILTTPEIAFEFGEPLPTWIAIQAVKDKKYQNFLETQVDYGEASAIALCHEIDNATLLLDDLKARKLASKLKMNFTGVLGIIHKSKQEGLISKVKPLIDRLLEANFRISDKIVEELLRLNDEIDSH